MSRKTEVYVLDLSTILTSDINWAWTSVPEKNSSIPVDTFLHFFILLFYFHPTCLLQYISLAISSFLFFFFNGIPVYFIFLFSHYLTFLSCKLLLLGHRSLIKNKTQTAEINIVNQRILYRLDVSYARQHTFSKVTVTIF